MISMQSFANHLTAEIDVAISRWQIEGMSVATIENQILGLSATERAKLIDVLWDSLSSPERKSREVAWAEESERRIDAFESGALTSRDAEAVFTDLRKGLRK